MCRMLKKLNSRFFRSEFLYYRKKTENLRLIIASFPEALENNIMTQRSAEMIKGGIYKKYAIYDN